MPRKKKLSEVIKSFNKVHNGKYDYSKVEYKDTHTKVCIICPKHGEFWQTPLNHSQGHGCPKCNGGISDTVNDFISKANKKHENKYIYTKIKYNGAHTKVCIICPKHGEFWQIPGDHLFGCGCPKCGDENKGMYKVGNIENFVKNAKIVHDNKYDYSKVKYVNNREKVTIICPKHGEFNQSPQSHLQGNGCPICKQSKLEVKIKKLLDSNRINYKYQYRTLWLGLQSLDFYLPKYNIAIECQGRQHYEIVDAFGGKKEFENIVKRDKLKLKKCEDNNIKLLYFSDKKYDDSIIIDENNLLKIIINEEKE